MKKKRLTKAEREKFNNNFQALYDLSLSTENSSPKLSDDEPIPFHDDFSTK